MLGISNRKNKINIVDYPYKRDIANRLFLSELSPFDIQILQELLFHSTKVNADDLADSANCKMNELQKSLDKFSRIGLTVKQGDTVFVDKELRKYFEFQIEKYDDRFEPSFDYLQGLLSKVPISLLPSWYSIPRSSDNIFQSIVEKYLLTPKIYENHLAEVSFSDPIINEMIRDVYESHNLLMPAKTLRERYKLSKVKFQEYLLLLEFHFVLVSTFDNGQESVSPFHEWREYQLFLRNKKPTPLDSAKITHIEQRDPVSTIAKQEEAMKLFRTTIESWQREWSAPLGSVERSVYEIEKALRQIAAQNWIKLEEFIDSMIAPIGKQEPVSLQKAGKKWRYALPQYSPHERAFIRLVIQDLLFKVGITDLGRHQNSPCFKITPFGRVALGEQ